MALYLVTDGKANSIADINQIVDLLNGTTGGGQAVKLVALNEAAVYPLTIKNLATTACPLLLVQDHAGTSVVDINNDLITLGNDITLSSGIYARTVPKVIARKGGSTTSWDTAGATNQSVSNHIAIQLGNSTASQAAGASLATVTVTFATAFAYVPIVLGPFWRATSGVSDPYFWKIAPTATNFTCNAWFSGANPGPSAITYDFSWLAIGPVA
jgi:hypothetical protein